MLIPPSTLTIVPLSLVVTTVCRMLSCRGYSFLIGRDVQLTRFHLVRTKSVHFSLSYPFYGVLVGPGSRRPDVGPRGTFLNRKTSTKVSEGLPQERKGLDRRLTLKTKRSRRVKDESVRQRCLLDTPPTVVVLPLVRRLYHVSRYRDQVQRSRTEERLYPLSM